MPSASLDFGGHFHESLLSMIIGAGAMVQFILLLLLVFSVVSWAIILTKYRWFRKVTKENEVFSQAYLKSMKLADLVPEAKRLKNSCIAEVFRAGYGELAKIMKVIRSSTPVQAEEEQGIPALEMRSIDNIERAVNRACGVETTKLESALGFLGTTGSASPFIGLFGTVWGIMDTFKGIGARGSATLAVVAPGISEALIATAAGLAAAIPAVIFYNYFLNRIKTMSLEMDHFSAELLNIIERSDMRR